MKQIYTWELHDNYARYWTIESIEHQEAFRKLKNIEGKTQFGPLYDKAEKYLAKRFNPNKLEVWNPPLIKEEIDEYKIVRKKGDYHSTWGGDGVLLSQNMVDKIEDILLEYGDLFPLEVEDREDKLYRYWVTSEIPLSCIDKEKSKFFDNDCTDDYVFLIEKLVLKKECLDVPMIFRVSEEYKKNIFLTDEFIELIKKHNLVGFKFSKDTSYECAGHEDCHILVG